MAQGRAELTEKTQNVVQKMFPQDQQDEVQELLVTECGLNLPLVTIQHVVLLEQIRFSVLKMAGGDMDELYGAITLAQTDWRDAIMGAGFGVSGADTAWADAYLAE